MQELWKSKVRLDLSGGWSLLRLAKSELNRPSHAPSSRAQAEGLSSRPSRVSRCMGQWQTLHSISRKVSLLLDERRSEERQETTRF